MVHPPSEPHGGSRDLRSNARRGPAQPARATENCGRRRDRPGPGLHVARTRRLRPSRGGARLRNRRRATDGVVRFPRPRDWLERPANAQTFAAMEARTRRRTYTSSSFSGPGSQRLNRRHDDGVAPTRETRRRRVQPSERSRTETPSGRTFNSRLPGQRRYPWRWHRLQPLLTTSVRGPAGGRSPVPSLSVHRTLSQIRVARYEIAGRILLTWIVAYFR